MEPAVLPALVDPFTGHPFVYRREGEGFIMYSFGPDGENDNGVYHSKSRVSPPAQDDIAWRME